MRLADGPCWAEQLEHRVMHVSFAQPTSLQLIALQTRTSKQAFGM